MPDAGEISDALGAISVLLVFVIAYFSALYPLARAKRNESYVGLSDENKGKAQKELGALELLVSGVFGLGFLIFLLVLKDAIDIAGHPSRWWPWSHDFTIAYGALLLVALFIFTLLVVLVVNIALLERARRGVSRKGAKGGNDSIGGKG